ncbi:decapping and exoribonuclease protein-like isoform X2 [Venturia canescens]|uniref:decapping and exoribonuclease protein-like isoform X2 n=1 Tax=Venturia canescens TaxID=32260 RepID=UPI001C9CBDD4|nr:decapping and exoribonuclease protein-like isoform X2 [Venturia canescens]
MTSNTPWRSQHRQTHDRGNNNRVFEVRNRFSQKETSIDLESKPEIVGYFSLDGNRTYLPDASNLSYYNPPKIENVCLDLNKGIEKVRRKSASADEEKIRNLLKWISLNNDKIPAPVESRSIEPTFVCFRGLLRLLLCTPYSPKDPWIICAARWKGTIYLCEFKTPEEKRRNANMSKEMLKFMSWGFKFEKYILSDAPDQQPDASQPVDESEEFCCMFQRKIGLRYFNPVENPVPIDLNEGFENIVVSQAEIKKIRALQWIDENRDTIKASPETGRLIEPNFVCSPQTLVLFMSASYVPFQSWGMWAAKWQGTIYIKTAAGFNRGNYENDEKFWYRNHKFCEYVVSESPKEAPNPKKPLVKDEAFRCIYQRQFGQHSVLYSASRKAVLSDKIFSDPLPLDELKFIDLRISKTIKYQGQETYLKKYIFLRWWANVILVNDDQVLCGFRDDNGIVHELKTYKTDDLPKLSEGFWDPQKCLDSCETILTTIAETVVEDCDKMIYEIVKKPRKNIEINKLEPSEENSVVPEWYKNSMIR